MTKEVNGLKGALYERYFGLTLNIDNSEIKKILADMLKLKKLYNIEDLKFDFIMNLCQLDLESRTGYLFSAQCALTEEMLEYMRGNEDWVLIDIRISICATLSTDDIERAIFIKDKALQVRNEKYPEWKTDRELELKLTFNLTSSLLKVYYLKLDKKNPNIDIRKTLSQYIERVIVLAKQEGNDILRLAVLVRKALFEDNVPKAVKILEEVKKLKNDDLTEVLQDEIDHYNYYVNKVEGTRIIKVDTSKALRYFRKSRGFTMAELAGRLNVSADTVSYIENQKVVMSITVLANAARVFEVSIDEFKKTGKRLADIKKVSKSKKARAYINSLDDDTIETLAEFAKVLEKKKR